MKRVSSRLMLLLLLATVALLPSCRKVMENARKNIRVESIVKVEPHGLSGADLTLRVKNDTRHKLVLNHAKLLLWYSGVCVGEVILRDQVEVERRTTGDVLTSWKFKIDDPIALFSLVRKVAKDDLSEIGVSYELDGRGGPMPVKLSHHEMPLSDFLRIFGIKAEDLKSHFGK